METNQLRIVIFNGRPVTPMLQSWVQRQGAGDVQMAKDVGQAFPSMAVWRNAVVVDFLQSPYDYLLMLDHDIIPAGDIDVLTSLDAPIVGCKYLNALGHVAHPEDGMLPAGALRVHRSVFEAITPPWFGFDTTPDGGTITMCECGYFCNKAKEAGYYPLSAGIVGHIVQAVVLPVADATDGSHIFQFLAAMEEAHGEGG